MVHHNSLCFHIDKLGKYPFRLANSLADWASLGCSGCGERRSHLPERDDDGVGGAGGGVVGKACGLGIALRDGGDARVQFCGLLRRKRPGEREKEPGTKRQPRFGTQASSLTLTTADQQRCHSL